MLVKKIALLCAALAITVSTASAETRTFRASRDYCQVEIRSGNYDSNPEMNQVIHSGGVSAGFTQSSGQPMWVRRESNPGHCGSSWSYWLRCTWGTCDF